MTQPRHHPWAIAPRRSYPLFGLEKTLAKYIARLTTLALGLTVWVALEGESQAGVLLAQQGMAKTAIGWTLVLLCVLLGMLVVLRPNGRRFADPADQPAPKVKKGQQQRRPVPGGH